MRAYKLIFAALLVLLWCSQAKAQSGQNSLPHPGIGPCAGFLSGLAPNAPPQCYSDNVINVLAPPYNAKGNGRTDDYAAIQAAIYAASGAPNPPTGTPTFRALKPVYLPSASVCYAISKPLRIPTQLFVMYGAGRTSQLCPTFSGNAIIEESWGAPGALPYGASLVSGVGNSLVSPNGGQVGKFIDLARFLNTNQGHLPNLISNYFAANGFNFAFFMKWGGGTGGDQVFSSTAAYPGSGDGAWKWDLNTGTGVVTATVNTSGGLLTFACPAQAANTVYELELDWNKTAYKAWQGVPGGTATQCGSTQTSSDPIIASKYEEILLPDGAPTQYWPDNSSNNNNPFQGNLDSIKLDSGSIHQSAYTVPTTKFAVDGGTVYLTNFEASLDGTQIGYTQQGGLTSVYSTILGGSETLSGVAASNLHDFEMCATANGNPFVNKDGLFVSGADDSFFTNLSCVNSSYVGFDFENNDYFTRAQGLITLGAHVGINFGVAWNGSMSIKNDVDEVDAACYVFAGGGTTTETNAECVDRGALDYFEIENSTSVIHNALQIDAEVLDTNTVAGMLSHNSGPDIYNGGVIPGQNGVPYILEDSGNGGDVFTTTAFPIAASTPSDVIKFTGSAPTLPERLINVPLPTGVSISNDPQYVFVNGTSFVTFAQLNTITCPTAGLAPDGAQGWLVSDDTTCTTGSLVDDSGTTYCSAICKNGVGWIH